MKEKTAEKLNMRYLPRKRERRSIMDILEDQTLFIKTLSTSRNIDIFNKPRQIKNNFFFKKRHSYIVERVKPSQKKEKERKRRESTSKIRPKKRNRNIKRNSRYLSRQWLPKSLSIEINKNSKENKDLQWFRKKDSIPLINSSQNSKNPKIDTRTKKQNKIPEIRNNPRLGFLDKKFSNTIEWQSNSRRKVVLSHVLAFRKRAQSLEISGNQIKRKINDPGDTIKLSSFLKKYHEENQNQKNNVQELKEFLNGLTYQVVVENINFLSEQYEILENLGWGVKSKMKKIRRVIDGKRFVGKFVDLKSLVSEKILNRLKVESFFITS